MVQLPSKSVTHFLTKQIFAKGKKRYSPISTKIYLLTKSNCCMKTLFLALINLFQSLWVKCFRGQRGRLSIIPQKKVWQKVFARGFSLEEAHKPLFSIIDREITWRNQFLPPHESCFLNMVIGRPKSEIWGPKHGAGG